MAIIPILLALLSCHSGPDTTQPDTSHLEKDVLHLETKISLPGVKGRIDHLAYDAAGHRVFIAALGNNTVEVVDLPGKARMHTITGLHEPQGVLYIPSLQRLVVANGGDGNCVFFNGSRPTAKIPPNRYCRHGPNGSSNQVNPKVFKMT